MYADVGFFCCAAVNTLQYTNGYVSFKAQPDNVIPHTHNAAQCAQLCQRDSNCVAWTRVAGELPVICLSGNAHPSLLCSRSYAKQTS